MEKLRLKERTEWMTSETKEFYSRKKNRLHAAREFLLKHRELGFVDLHIHNLWAGIKRRRSVKESVSQVQRWTHQCSAFKMGKWLQTANDAWHDDCALRLT